MRVPTVFRDTGRPKPHEHWPYGPINPENAYELRNAGLKTGVFGGADAVFDARAGVVAALQDGDVCLGVVGEDGLEAVTVVVAEGEFARRGAGAHDARSPAIPRASPKVQVIGGLGDLVVVARRVQGFSPSAPWLELIQR